VGAAGPAEGTSAAHSRLVLSPRQGSLAAGSQCAGNTLNVLAMPKPAITSPADLAGKTIAVNLTSNIQTLTINAVLRDQGVRTSGIKYVIIPFPDMPSALQAAQLERVVALMRSAGMVSGSFSATPLLFHPGG
jgi:NitT/TauT family transport system substrate-binding protein